MVNKNPSKYFKASPGIIRLAVMFYVRYPLSYRQVEDILHQRGIDICHENVRFWVGRFGLKFASEIREKRARHHSNWQWHLDEVFVKISGERFYLWRAVDHKGEVLGPCCTDRLRHGTRPTRDGFQAVRSNLGRPSLAIRFSTGSPILVSVF
jgi:putative transposase